MENKYPIVGRLADSLRDAVLTSGLTHYRIGKDIGIGADQVDRFMDGRDIRLSTAEKLAAYFQMRFTKPKKPKKRDDG